MDSYRFYILRAAKEDGGVECTLQLYDGTLILSSGEYPREHKNANKNTNLFANLGD
jgi:hypothetical protein